jgi:hypothetical protein
MLEGAVPLARANGVTLLATRAAAAPPAQTAQGERVAP